MNSENSEQSSVVYIYLVCFAAAIGLGALPWLMMSEIQPTRIRAKAVAITTTITWIAIFGVILLFPTFISLSKTIFGSALGVFLLFACVCVLSLLFGLTMLPETKNKSLEEIADLWLKNK